MATVDRPPYAALVAELAELGFAAEHYPTPGPRHVAAPGTALTVVVDDGRRPPRAVLTTDTTPAWEITLTGDVPDETQVMALYAPLHPHDRTRTAATT